MKQTIKLFVFNRLALIFSIMILMLTGLSIGYLYNVNQVFYENKYEEQVSNFEWVMSEWLKSGHQELAYLRENFNYQGGELQGQHLPLQQLWAKKTNRFDYIFMATKYGDYITSKNMQSKNIADRKYFQEALLGNPYTSEMVSSRLTNNNMMVLSMPLYDSQHKLSGVFAGAIELSSLTYQMTPFQLGDKYVKAYIVDRNGYVGSLLTTGDYTPEKENLKSVGVPIETVLSLKRPLLGSSGKVNQPGEMIYYKNIEGGDGWKVVLVVGRAALYEGMGTQLTLIFIIAVALLMVVYRLSRNIAYEMVKPVEQLNRAFDDMMNHSKFVRKMDYKLLEMDELFHKFEKTRAEINRLTYEDPLTDLTNITYFRQLLQQMLNETHEKLVEQYVLVFLEIDHFKIINDTFGFSGGDAVLRHIATWLKAREDVLEVSKMNGDEFAFLVNHEWGVLRVYEIREALNAILSEGICYQGSRIMVTASFGVTHFYDEDTSAEACFQNAYIALNEAKKDGTASLEVFNQRLKSRVTRRVMLEMSMRTALENDEMYPVYQPIIGVDGEQVQGYESLIRWDSKDHGFVAPNEFIPIAEDSKFIVHIGRWMILKTFQDLKRLKEINGEHVYLSLNASSIEFEEVDFADYLKNQTLAFGHKPVDIIVELTERVMMVEKPEVQANIQKLIEYGFKLSLDDFGTGYSSLSYLLKYPFSVVKIDRSFVANTHERSAQDLLEVMRLIAEKYSLKTVAEGVESEDHASRIREIGFHYGQGYFYGKPMKLEDIKS